MTHVEALFGPPHFVGPPGTRCWVREDGKQQRLLCRKCNTRCGPPVLIPSSPHILTASASLSFSRSFPFVPHPLLFCKFTSRFPRSVSVPQRNCEARVWVGGWRPATMPCAHFKNAPVRKRQCVPDSFFSIDVQRCPRVRVGVVGARVSFIDMVCAKAPCSSANLLSPVTYLAFPSLRVWSAVVDLEVTPGTERSCNMLNVFIRRRFGCVRFEIRLWGTCARP